MNMEEYINTCCVMRLGNFYKRVVDYLREEYEERKAEGNVCNDLSRPPNRNKLSNFNSAWNEALPLIQSEFAAANALQCDATANVKQALKKTKKFLKIKLPDCAWRALQTVSNLNQAEECRRALCTAIPSIAVDMGLVTKPKKRSVAAVQRMFAPDSAAEVHPTVLVSDRSVPVVSDVELTCQHALCDAKLPVSDMLCGSFGPNCMDMSFQEGPMVVGTEEDCDILKVEQQLGGLLCLQTGLTHMSTMSDSFSVSSDDTFDAVDEPMACASAERPLTPIEDMFVEEEGYPASF